MDAARAGGLSPTPELPHLASLGFRADHRRLRLARERLLELGQVGERTDDSILADRVRVALDHRSRELRPDGVAAKLPPRDEELLVRSEAVDRRERRLV